VNKDEEDEEEDPEAAELLTHLMRDLVTAGADDDGGDESRYDLTEPGANRTDRKRSAVGVEVCAMRIASARSVR
jgi:hypothetical protein